MRFTEFTGRVPNKKKGSKLYAEMTEFINMNVKCAKVTYSENEYKDYRSAYSTLHSAARKYYPEKIQVIAHEYEIYFIRKDL